MTTIRITKEEIGEAVSKLKNGEGVAGRFYWVGGVKWVRFTKSETGQVKFRIGKKSANSYAYMDIDTAWSILTEEHHLFPPKELVPITKPATERMREPMPRVECEEMRGVLSDAQAMKLATMMLYAADYKDDFMILPAVHMESLDNNAEENARKVEEAMKVLCNDMNIDSGKFSSLRNRVTEHWISDMFWCGSRVYVGESTASVIHDRYGSAPIYTDRRMQEVTLYRGVWVNGDNKKINAVYIDAYQPTGEYGDSERIDRAIMRQERILERHTGYRNPSKEKAYRDAERRVEDYEQRKDTFCHGIGQRRVKLFLNACIKAGDEVAQMYRLALEAEGVNLNAKKALKKYHSDYHAYDKKEECLRQLSDMCKRMSVVFGVQASTAPAARYVVYYELPGCEQVSFHTNEPQAQNWPHYDGTWDGKKCSTLGKLENAIWQRYESELTKKYLKD